VSVNPTFFLYCSRHTLLPHSFPTRRSSDLMPSFWLGLMLMMIFATRLRWFPSAGMVDLKRSYTGFAYYMDLLKHLVLPVSTLARSEEHTSELQSRFDLVCGLLLE